jgi:ABC-type transport system substrate-binding protein
MPRLGVLPVTNSLSATTAAAPAGTTVRVGLLTSINKLDPRDAVEAASGLVLSQLFETPYLAGPGQSEAQPLLFHALRREDANTTAFSAAVQEGIRFSDGTPLTPELAARSLRGASVLAHKVTIDVRGDRLWFTLPAPNPRFDLTLTHNGCSILHDTAFQLHGTGPFMFERRPNLRLLQTSPTIRLVRNPHSRVTGGPDAIEFVVLPADENGSPSRVIEALRTGTIDVTTAVTSSEIAANQLLGMTPVTQTGISTALLYFNTERRLLASSDARRAIASAIDLLEIASRCYDRNPAAFVAADALPPSMGRPSAMRMGNGADAQRLVDSSGLRGARLTLIVPWAPRPYLTKPMAVAQAIQTQLAAVGIAVSLHQSHSSDEFFETLNAGRFDLALAGWIADTPDPADFYEALLWSKCLGGENHANNSRWNHAPTDAALLHFRTDPSESNRSAIQAIMTSEVPFVPLVYGHTTVVHSRRLRRVPISPVGLLRLAEIKM